MEEGFAESLIAEVQERPALWNRKYKHYRNRVVIDKDWADVAENLGISKEAAKLKWRNLRDNFKKELKKIPKPNPDGSTELLYKGKWSYFAHMLFLKDILEPQNVDGRIMLDTENPNNMENMIANDFDSDNEHYLQCPISPNISIRTDSTRMSDVSEIMNNKSEEKEKRQQMKRHRTVSESNEQMHTDAKISKMADTGTQEDCEDMHFFKSILPYMAMLSPIKKLQVRNQFNFVLIKEISALIDDRAQGIRKSSNNL